LIDGEFLIHDHGLSFRSAAPRLLPHLWLPLTLPSCPSDTMESSVYRNSLQHRVRNFSLYQARKVTRPPLCVRGQILRLNDDPYMPLQQGERLIGSAPPAEIARLPQGVAGRARHTYPERRRIPEGSEPPNRRRAGIFT